MSNSSHPQTRSTSHHPSSETLPINFSAPSTICTAQGAYDDAAVVREALVKTIKRSGLTREVVAERMSYLLGRTVTEKMLNAFTAESRDDRRWPAEYDRAFCEATGDNTLLRERAVRAGLIVIDESDRVLLELGRNYIDEKRARTQRERIESSLLGGAA